LSQNFPVTYGTDLVKEMSWFDFCWISLPCGLVTAGDVGLSNLAMVHASLGLYTMIKASAPLFVVFFAFILGVEKFRFSIIFIVLIISIGEFLTVEGEKYQYNEGEKYQYNMTALFLCLFASMMSGLRWTVIQFTLTNMSKPFKTTFVMMRVINPSMFISMLIFSLAIERPWEKLTNLGVSFIYVSLAYGLAGASLAVSMILCEFYLIRKSNAIILMLGGVLKEIITILGR